MAGGQKERGLALRYHPDPEQVDPPESLLRALDETAREIAEREAAERIAQARSDHACDAATKRKGQVE